MARQYTVIDFQHKDRAGEHENIAHPTEYGDRNERAAAGRQRRRKFGLSIGIFPSGKMIEAIACVPADVPSQLANDAAD